MSETSYLTRYLAGDHIAVWNEVRNIPAHQLYERPLFTDVYSVAQETMRRVRTNLEILKRRWEDAGLEFEYFNVIGSPVDVSVLDELVVPFRDRMGQFPISLQAFWETIGSVNFCARDQVFTTPGTEDTYHGSDPLWIYPASSIVGASIIGQEWEWDEIDDEINSEGLRADFAPDSIHKDNMSGGGPLSFLLTAGADCQIYFSDYTEYEEAIPFIDYLRLSIKWAGFPGFSLYGKPNDPEWAYEEHDQYDQRTPPAILHEMAHDLLPF